MSSIGNVREAMILCSDLNFKTLLMGPLNLFSKSKIMIRKINRLATSTQGQDESTNQKMDSLNVRKKLQTIKITKSICEKKICS